MGKTFFSICLLVLASVFLTAHAEMRLFAHDPEPNGRFFPNAFLSNPFNPIDPALSVNSLNAFVLETDIGVLNIIPQSAYVSEDFGYNGLEYQSLKPAQFELAFSGEVPRLGFEGALAYRTINFSNSRNSSLMEWDDTFQYGVYGNMWATLDVNRVGMLFAYYGWEDEALKGDGFGKSQKMSLWSKQNTPLLLDVSNSSSWGSGFSGLMLGRIYGELAVGDNLFLTPSVTYVTDNDERINAFSYEINFAADYYLTDILIYSARFSFADTEMVSRLSDPEISKDYKFVQQLRLKF